MRNIEAGSVTVRRAREQDVPRMREIAVKAWAPIYAAIRQRVGEELYRLEGYHDWQTMQADEVSGSYDRHPEWCLVAELSGQIVGFMTFMLHEDKSIGEIWNNAVDPDYQGQGIGTAQCRRVLEIFEQRGMKYAKVCTGLDPAHAPARAMYEKVGFEQTYPFVVYRRRLQGG